MAQFRGKRPVKRPLQGVQFYVPASLWKQLMARAAKSGVRASDIVREAVYIVSTDDHGQALTTDSPPTKQAMVLRSCRVPTQAWKAFGVQCAYLDISAAEGVRRAISAFLTQHGGGKK